MRSIINVILIFITWIGTATLCQAQDSIRYHQDKVDVIEIDKSRLDQYRDNPDFNYMTVKPKDQSKISLFWSKIGEALLSVLRSTSESGALKWIFYLIGGGGIIFIILKMLGMNIKNLTKRSSAAADIKGYELDEDIHELDFEKLLKASIESKDYREAIRWLYLFALRKLSEEDRVHWMPGKTNREYLAEIGAAPFSAPFQNLSYYFEYIWYGNFGVPESLFQTVQETFDQFTRQLAANQ